MVSVSIIFVNYNGREYLKDCLYSLEKQTFKDFEIIFVDNASNDDSVEFVKRTYPKVKIIESEKNLGFAAGNNLGVRKAKGKYIFILNLDTELDKNCLKELVSYIKKNKDIIICPKILLFDKRDKINTTGIAFHYLGFGWCDNLGKVDNQFKEKEITFPSGSAFLINKKIYNIMKGFDEDYFFYYEDDDLGWRLRLRGYKIMLVPKARIYHKYSFSRHSKKFYFAERNRIITVLKNYHLKTLFLILPPFLLTEIGILFYSLTNGLFFSKLNSYYWILKNVDKISEKRKAIQKTRKVTDKEIVKYFFSKIMFKEVTSPLIEYILNPILNFYWKIIKAFI